MNLIDGVRNYYEHLVTEHINAQDLHLRFDNELLSDLCCLVLNKLPPRYIRYEVDMAFFLSVEEREEMNQRVADTVQSVLLYLEQRQKEHPAEELGRR